METNNHDISEQELLHALLREDLTAYIHKVFQTVSPGSLFLPNWHIEAIAYVLMECIKGNITRLIITIPPRYLKSISCSVALPSYILGHNPAEQIICISHSQELALKHASDTRLVMQSDWYSQLFPGTALGYLQDTQSKILTAQNGFRYATSIGGSLTGLGGNWIFIDDPHKAEEASSDSLRHKTLNWIDQTAMSRLNDKKNGRIILIQQRLHQADLAGHFIDQGEWHHLNLPVIAEQDSTIPIGPDKVYHRKAGDILHPERESEDELKQREREMGPYAYAAQYQQRPSPLGGGIVKLDWFKRYTQLKHPMHAEHIVQAWDIAITANEQSDWTVCTTWYAMEGNLYLVDVFRQKIGFPQLSELVFSQAKKFHATDVVIEAVGAGQALYQQVDSQKRKMTASPFTLWRDNPKHDKATRLMTVSPEIAAGRVFLPEKADWLQAFGEEILNFPNGKHDDQVDSLTLGLKWAKAKYFSQFS